VTPLPALSLTILPRRTCWVLQPSGSPYTPCSAPMACCPRSWPVAGQGRSCGCPARQIKAAGWFLVGSVFSSRPYESHQTPRSGRDVSELISPLRLSKPKLRQRQRERYAGLSDSTPDQLRDVTPRQRSPLPCQHDRLILASGPIAPLELSQPLAVLKRSAARQQRHRTDHSTLSLASS